MELGRAAAGGGQPCREQVLVLYEVVQDEPPVFHHHLVQEHVGAGATVDQRAVPVVEPT